MRVLNMADMGCNSRCFEDYIASSSPPQLCNSCTVMMPAWKWAHRTLPATLWLSGPWKRERKELTELWWREQKRTRLANGNSKLLFDTLWLAANHPMAGTHRPAVRPHVVAGGMRLEAGIYWLAGGLLIVQACLVANPGPCARRPSSISLRVKIAHF